MRYYYLNPNFNYLNIKFDVKGFPRFRNVYSNRKTVFPTSLIIKYIMRNIIKIINFLNNKFPRYLPNSDLFINISTVNTFPPILI